MTRVLCRFVCLVLCSTTPLALACGPSAGGGSGGPDGGGDLDGGGGGDGGELDGGPGGGGGDDDCTGGSLCGSPAVCCPSGTECVDETCLAACASGVRCGADQSVCCGDGTVCMSDECVAPGEVCADSYDCDPGSFCEPTLGQCLPQPEPAHLRVRTRCSTRCRRRWSGRTRPTRSSRSRWSPTSTAWARRRWWSTSAAARPAGRPTGPSAGSRSWTARPVQVVLPEIPHAPAADPPTYGSHGRATIALGDVSGDGLPDIIYAARRQLRAQPDRRDRRHRHAPVDLARRRTTTPTASRWRTAARPWPTSTTTTRRRSCSAARSSTTTGWWCGIRRHAGSGGYLGTNSGYSGGISAVVDLDGDGAPEIVIGQERLESGVDAGQPAVGDGDARTGPTAGPTATRRSPTSMETATPEVVLVASGQRPRAQRPDRPAVVRSRSDRRRVRVQPGPAHPADHHSRSVANNLGGPPTVARLRRRRAPGDRRGRRLQLFGLRPRPRRRVDRRPIAIRRRRRAPSSCAGRRPPRTCRRTRPARRCSTSRATARPRWSTPTSASCASTPAPTGPMQLETPNTTGTIHEYPLVVDVDGDGNSEIMVVANDSKRERQLRLRRSGAARAVRLRRHQRRVGPHPQGVDAARVPRHQRHLGRQRAVARAGQLDRSLA